MDLAILVGHEVRRVKTMHEWGQWFELASKTPGPRGRCTMRHVDDDTVGEIRVSTVFIGIDHSWGAGPPPLWFETMVFGGKLDQMMQRYTTWEQAQAGHAYLLAIAKGEAAIVREQVVAELARIARSNKVPR